MNPNVTKGTRTRGLLEYLWGPGKSDEHENPRIVAGYDDPSVLAPPQHPDDPTRWDLADLAARLDAPQTALGERGLRDYVLQVSLSVRSDERPISDEEWGRIAHRYVEKMGFAGDGDRAGCRWIAVHHGQSVSGNDHIHLVVTRATEDGAPVYLRGEWRQSQQVCDELETEFGLRKDSPGRVGATRRRGASRPEVDQARRAGKPVTDREALRREVRAALAGARSEREWIARMKAAGLRVAARKHKDDPQVTVGYAVSMPPSSGGKPRWLSGRLLDGDLSLHRVRQRWPDGPRLSPAEWAAVEPRERLALAGPRRIEVWRASAAALDDVVRRLEAVPPDSPQWAAIARACADTLAATAVVAEPAGSGPVSRAADILARAAAPPRRDPPPPVDSPIAQELGRIADAMTVAGVARHSVETAVIVALVVAASRLIVALARLREAQQQVHAAGAARVAAQRVMPLLRQAATVTTTQVGEPLRWRQDVGRPVETRPIAVDEREGR
ncbi:relaxase [Polymorphospora sp. NPDC050346]|uniref:relaxase/mobilization nuclease domain-containing protein n=1 Tax=Polymorphospora sp. NPDC050346 TaxID=3155780 RepID=UPI0033E860F2